MFSDVFYGDSPDTWTKVCRGSGWEGLCGKEKGRWKREKEGRFLARVSLITQHDLVTVPPLALTRFSDLAFVSLSSLSPFSLLLLLPLLPFFLRFFVFALRLSDLIFRKQSTPVIIETNKNPFYLFFLSLFAATCPAIPNFLSPYSPLLIRGH